MGEIKTEKMDGEKEFLGGMSEREFFKRLNFQRQKFDGLQRGHK
jgi:hypothetical protein